MQRVLMPITDLMVYDVSLGLLLLLVVVVVVLLFFFWVCVLRLGWCVLAAHFATRP
jgi:hypothetical protein